jgi:hypothetical protein
MNHLSWPVRVKGKAFGVCLGLWTNEPTLLDRVAPILPPGWMAAESGRIDRLYLLKARDPAGYRLSVAGRRLVQTADLDHVIDRLETDMQIFLGESSREYVFVHAGVVVWRGKAILIPGRSYSGKSTLVAALLRAGAAYYSDEFAVLDRNGLVHPYPRLLSLRQADGTRPLRFRPESLGSQQDPGPLSVGLVLLTRYCAESSWRPRPISLGTALLRLLQHCVPIRRRPADVLTVLQRALMEVPVLRGARGEAQDTAPKILNFMETSHHPRRGVARYRKESTYAHSNVAHSTA